MLEVELKVKVPGHKEYIDQIERLGALKKHDLIEIDTYFNHPSRDFRTTDEAFRIRDFGDKSCITYKGPKLAGEIKSRFEAETDIGDPKTFMTILQKLGFRESGVVEKKRSVYSLGNMEICFDDVKNAGLYIEFEMMGEDKERMSSEIMTFAKNLGLKDVEKRSYLHIVLENSGIL